MRQSCPQLQYDQSNLQGDFIYIGRKKHKKCEYETQPRLCFRYQKYNWNHYYADLEI